MSESTNRFAPGQNHTPQAVQPPSKEFNMNSAPSQQKALSASWGGLVAGAASPLPRNAVSERLSSLKDALGNFIKANSREGVELSLVEIDPSNSPEIGFCVLNLVLKYSGADGVAYHSLVIEDKAHRNAVSMVNEFGTSVPVTTYAADHFTPAVRRHISKVVSQTKRTSAVDSGFTVVPVEFNIADTDLIRKLTVSAALAADSALSVKNSTQPVVDIAQLASAEPLVLRPTFGNDDAVNAVGQPVRADITLSLGYNAAGQALPGVQAAPVFNQLTEITGFVDLEYANTQAPANVFGVQQPAQPGKVYNPHFVCTSLRTTGFNGTAAQLLALATAVAGLRDGNTYMHTFMHQAEIAGHKVHDLAGIGHEVANGALEYTPEQLGLLVDAYLRNNLKVSLDVQVGGPDSWQSAILAAAASGDEAANRALFQTANSMTNGKFGEIYGQMNGNGRFVEQDVQRVHNGYFTSSAGVHHDARHVDYTYVLNRIGGKDQTTIVAWSDSFLSQEMTPNQKLAQRRRVLEQVQSCYITGTSIRVTLNPVAVEALIAALRACGLELQTNKTQMGQLMQSRATAGDRSYFSSAASGLTNSGFGQPRAGHGYGNQYGYYGGNHY